MFGVFVLNIFLIIISSVIDRLFPQKKRGNIKKKIVVIHAILFIGLILSFSFLIDLGISNALIVIAILLVGTQLSDWAGNRLAIYLDIHFANQGVNNQLGLDQRSSIYQNSFSFFIYAVALYTIGIMSKSPIWFLAGSIFTISAIANAFFEFSMKEGIYRLDSDSCSDAYSLWSEFFVYDEWPLAFMLATILIYYPISWNLFDADTLRNVYLALLAISSAMIGVVYSAGLSSVSRLKDKLEKKALDNFVSSFYMLCIILIFISLFGYIHVHDPIDLQKTISLMNIPISLRGSFIWKDIIDIILLGSSVCLFVGICLYMRSIMSLFMRIRDK